VRTSLTAENTDSAARLKGNALILANALCLAVGSVVARGYLTDIDPIVFTFYCFVLVVATTLVLRVVIYRSLSNIWASLLANRKHFLLLNVATAVDWICYFVAIKISDGALANALLFGVAPIAALFLSRQQTRPKIAYSVVILILLGLLSLTYVDGTQSGSPAIYVAIVAGLLAGAAVGATTISMKALGSNHVKVIDVVLLRYLATIAATLVILRLVGTPAHLSFAQGVDTFWIAIVLVLVPTLLVQMGIRLISAFNTAVISSAIPALTYVVSLCFGGAFSIAQTVIFALLSLVLLKMSMMKNL
jgi:drug/metabolite transporter (DMT)-like permease